MTNNTSICPTCGRKITEYKHTINKTLVAGLAIGRKSKIEKQLEQEGKQVNG